MTPSIRRRMRQLQLELEPECCACLIVKIKIRVRLFLLSTDVILSKTTTNEIIRGIESWNVTNSHCDDDTNCVSSLNEAKRRRGMACNAGHEGLFYGDITHHHITRCHTQTQAHRHTHTHLHKTLSGQARVAACSYMSMYVPWYHGKS